MDSNEKVSVIMSVYNADKFLDKSIESILNQTYANIEFIIIDDGSTDTSKEIINGYAKKDERIIFIENEKNIGLTKNLNKAIELSTSNYIVRMDADDVCEKERIEKQMKFLQENKDFSIVGSCAKYINSKNEVEEDIKLPETNKEIKDMIYKVNPLIHPSVMFRKEDIVSIGKYNENLRKVQDYDLWFRAVSNGLKIYNIQECLLFLRRDETYNKRKSKEYRKIDFKVRKNGYKLLKLPIYKYIYLIIPIVLIILPSGIVDKLFYKLKRFDPRMKK